MPLLHLLSPLADVWAPLQLLPPFLLQSAGGLRGGSKDLGELRLDERRGGEVLEEIHLDDGAVGGGEAVGGVVGLLVGLGPPAAEQVLEWTEAARRAWRSCRGEAERPRSASAKPGEDSAEERLFSAARRVAASRERDCANQPARASSFSGGTSMSRRRGSAIRVGMGATRV
jgi:hypothetical protein